jgi:amidase
MSGLFDPREQGLENIAAALDAGRITSAQLVDFYLARIAAHDKAGASINAMIALHPDARTEAARLDAERGQGGRRGLLHGVPMVVKDNIDVAGLPTTAGSVVLRHHMPAHDAPVVARLRAAGAIVLGKTNMSEFASSNGRHGYSSLGGLTLNPYNRARNAAGSSSGSAAALAADFATFALGSDTFGSVRAPACVTGLTGVRPTHGLCSGAGVLPLAPSFDTVGPLARSVRDAAIVLQVLTGSAIDYLAALHPGALRGARIGVALDFPGDDAEVREIADSAWQRLAGLGAAMVPLWLPEPAATVHAAFLGPLADAELDASLGDYLARTPGAWPATLAQLVQAVTDPALVHSCRPVNPVTVGGLQRFLALARRQTAAQRSELLAQRAEFQQALEALMREQRLDAIVYPTLSCPASPRYDREDPSYAPCNVNPYAPLYVASAAGLPDVTVPAGMARAGVPVGISFMGAPYSEGGLLALAYAFEQAGETRATPDLRPAALP